LIKQSQKIRKAFLLVHRWAGLTAGLVVFIVSVTGCLYVFEEEWREIFQHKYLYVQQVKEKRKSITELSTFVQAAYPNEKITQLRFLEQKDAAFIFHTQSMLAVSINPYTGAIIGHRNLKTDFMNVVLDIHLHLFLGRVGKEIVRWNVLIFLGMCITGLILWWPKQKRFLRQSTTIKWRTKNWKRLNWDLHSVLGFYALFVLLIISLTGIFWVFDTAQHLVRIATGSPAWKAPEVRSMPTVLKKESPLDSAYVFATLQHPGAEQVFIAIPSDSVESIRVLFRLPYTIVRRQATVWFDQYSIKHLHTESYKKYTRYENLSGSIYDFHTGGIRALGIGSKIIYFLASLFAASLPITGTLIWFGRRNKRKNVKVEETISQNGASISLP
jgi:uncharacterized iron-regulated membrane protein